MERGGGGGEAKESWMVWGRRDSPLPRLQLWSDGGGELWERIGIDGHCKGTPIAFSWAHRFWQDQDLDRVGVGVERCWEVGTWRRKDTVF